MSGKNIETVVDFNQIREKKLDEKRRKNERIFFKQFLAVYAVIGKTKLEAIEIIDVSEEGLSFQIPYHQNLIQNADEALPLRLYFSQDTYLEVLLTVQNSRLLIETRGRFMRFGCKVDNQTAAYPAYASFVKFLKLYSEQAHTEQGGNTLFFA